MNTRTTKKTGDMGEKLAADFLVKKGYKIVGRNYRTGHGELDIIAENKEYILFVEVKTRNAGANPKYGRPADAIDKSKLSHLIYSAKVYLHDHPTNKKQRLDVIEVRKTEDGAGGFYKAEINHIENAFGA